MIRSMTGYGRAEAAGDRVAISVECRSVNHRHLDISLKLPRFLGGFELDARRLIQSAVQRGRVEATVSLAPVEGSTLNPLTINAAQARAFAEAARRLADELGLPGVPTVEWVLGQPGVVTREEQAPLSPEEAWPLLERALRGALAELIARREAEGLALGQELASLHATLGSHVETISARAPAAVERRTKRLSERIQALAGESPVDETRIATEIAIWAEKTDISEELARLRAHLDQLARLLAEGGSVGRTLDFVIQEINREVNTVGSKADDLEISQAVIAAKTALEKLREQVQNIE
jgi:uncharacterized protein (TIGR00255 family)